ncbi:MAG: hypothetical protein LAT64_14185 [Phycisphaerales bacterium]|nr:hypothetical protein [Planctomycetota bacterium]MCH8509900.1 hypothetical protein [Phycisphaerales bacterium]
MLLATAAITVVLAQTAQINPQSRTPTPAARPCVAPPPTADEACRECMDDACRAYIDQVTECGDDQVCLSIVRTNYELALLDCTTCNEEARAWRAVLAVVPDSQRAWINGIVSRESAD